MAWIKAYEVGSGPRYRVFWRDPSGRQQTKVFNRLNPARSFKRTVEQQVDAHGP